MCRPDSLRIAYRFAAAALFGLLILDASSAQDAASGKSPVVVRCAIVGGLNESDFWPQLADRFFRATGYQSEISVTGPKHVVTPAFKAGEADLIVMHSGDAIINLVADGHGENPQPWARNDYIIVGPPSDPAKIKGETDAVKALAKIIATRSKFLVHASSGVSEVLSDLLAEGELELDPEATISRPGERHRQMLGLAATEGAYTLVGRIPFLNGKLDASSLAIMVQGDARLRRPFLIVVATGKPDEPRLVAARRLAAFLREEATQNWLSEFGRGKLDDRPLFFRVSVPPAINAGRQ